MPSKHIGNPFAERSPETVAQELYGGADLPEPTARRKFSVTRGVVTIGRFTLTRTGLAVEGEASAQEWGEIGEMLRRFQADVLPWLIGDWAEYAHRTWGWTYQEIAERTGYEEGTLRSYTSVCRAAPMLIRNQHLSFSHHRLVAGMELDDQVYWLNRAEDEGWTLEEMRRAINPPALPSGPLVEFEKKYAGFERRALEMASGVGGSERRAMAERLRGLAAKIEGLG